MSYAVINFKTLISKSCCISRELEWEMFYLNIFILVSFDFTSPACLLYTQYTEPKYIDY